MVVIRAVGKAVGPAGLVEGHLGGKPGLPLEPVHDYGAFIAMKVAAEVGVGLHLPEVGQ